MKEKPEIEISADEFENSIIGKILCGYQGWFNAEGDGADLGWKHYMNKGKFEPGMCSIDFWPDMTEFDEDEKSIRSMNQAMIQNPGY